MFLSLMGLVFNMKWNLVHVLCIFYSSLRIQNFQKKTDACNVSLVLNTQGLEGVFPGGYHCPGRLVETPKGLNSFPTIFSYPGVCQFSSAYTSNSHFHLICFTSYSKWHSLFKLKKKKIHIHDINTVNHIKIFGEWILIQKKLTLKSQSFPFWCKIFS